MQIVINIDDDVYKRALVYKDVQLANNNANDLSELITAVANGTPLPNNVTNGDVIRTVFPKAEVIEKRAVVMVGISRMIVFDLDWWNSPYKAGDTDGNSGNDT